MSFEEFVKEAFEYQLEHPSLRWGQAIFNKLYEIRPDLVSKVPDPFLEERSKELKAILEQLKTIWDKKCITKNENPKLGVS